MNQDHLQHDYYTDIITFDYSEGLEISGDLFVSVDRVRDNAKQSNVLFFNELKCDNLSVLVLFLFLKDKNWFKFTT